MRYTLELGSLQAPGDAQTIVLQQRWLQQCSEQSRLSRTHHSLGALLALLGARNGERTGLSVAHCCSSVQTVSGDQQLILSQDNVYPVLRTWETSCDDVILHCLAEYYK